jgi:hypothetical protein
MYVLVVEESRVEQPWDDPKLKFVVAVGLERAGDLDLVYERHCLQL